MEWFEQDVCFARGFKAAGVRCGIKDSGNHDLALLVSDLPSLAFGAFTRNTVVAAPVTWCRKVLQNNAANVQAVVINSGNANACTGLQGEADTEFMATKVAHSLGLQATQVLVSSTGIIGRTLPMTKVQQGIEDAAKGLQSSVNDFAQAIMTTDTFPKKAAIKIVLGGGQEVRIGGCSKGAGMIHPDMATMLAFITTDLGLPLGFQQHFSQMVQFSFNAITVDGDTSTNDSCIMLANAASGLHWDDLNEADRKLFTDGLQQLMNRLAKLIVLDGEGATKFVTFRAKGALSNYEALKAARKVAQSLLVKTALFGQDPNWGRILAALGTSGVEFDPSQVEIWYEDVCLFKQGTPQKPDSIRLKEVTSGKEITITMILGSGVGCADAYTCDLSYDYVKINAEYST
jgi:glutamate N-acetyltransferase / amino-acid N-acetyltransferase